MDALDSPSNPVSLPAWRNDSILKLEMPRPGIIIAVPQNGSSDPLVISGGIHGNERAGVVTLDQIIEALTQGTLPVRRPVVLVYGNIEAMRANDRKGARTAPQDVGRRSNMNRCFGGTRFVDPTCSAEARANLIKEVLAVELRGQRGIVGIDVHQSFFVPSVEMVRGNGDRSEYTYSMLYPQMSVEQSLVWIYKQFSDIVAGAVLNPMNIEHETFAGYLAQTFGANAATFEQGTIGSTDPLTFVPQLLGNLCHKIAGEEVLYTPSGFDVWHCTQAMLKESEHFTFLDADGAPTVEVPHDFAPLGHSLIAQDGSVEYRVDPTCERLLFANCSVPIGDRAGVVIAPFETEVVPGAPI
jgi:succinylglutamate desuccinylase